PAVDDEDLERPLEGHGGDAPHARLDRVLFVEGGDQHAQHGRELAKARASSSACGTSEARHAALTSIAYRSSGAPGAAAADRPRSSTTRASDTSPRAHTFTTSREAPASRSAKVIAAAERVRKSG